MDNPKKLVLGQEEPGYVFEHYFCQKQLEKNKKCSLLFSKLCVCFSFIFNFLTKIYLCHNVFFVTH